ncbi:MAG: hypothetical protein COA74_08500 [Gammaproteobacteria bacterium]|nr:MAG: hypothetical protein COA74_11535 [Gammaproteobacteria bacterium]PCJ48429.1 MAG: hypothetical protein COA74_08500 [Gammaproteobacteria bacterium]
MVVYAISVKILQMTKTTKTTPYPAGFIRRLAALTYDSLVITALLFLSTGLVMLVVVVFMDETAITEQNILVENPLYFIWLMLTWFYYYDWCWRRGGQTLGMKAWRLQLVALDGGIISHKNALIRFASGLLGLANLTVLLHVSRGWHDILSHSNVMVIDKSA